MKHFQPREFKRLDLMDASFLRFLDAVRERANIAFRLTSDARTDGENERVGGSSTSLHLYGRAVDFVPASWDRETLWRVVKAVMDESANHSVELELVQSPRDHHIHLGLFVDKRLSRLVLNVT